MRGTTILIGILTAFLWVQASQADIYVWTDENGIKHFSNRKPQHAAELFLKTMEGPYEEAVERAQGEVEKQRELERAQAQIQEEKDRLAERIAKVERRAKEAQRKAREAEERAEALLEEADRRYQEDRWYSTRYASYYPGYYDYRHFGYYGYRFSVTYPSSKRYKRHRYRPGGSHRQISGGGHRRWDSHLQGSRTSPHRHHTAGQARFSGHRQGGRRP